MKITAITQQVKDPRRFSVSLDGSFGFGIDQTTLLDQKLKVGVELDDSQIEHLKNQAEVGKWYMKCLSKIYSRLHSEKEIREYLRRKDRTDIADAVVNKLAVGGYLDDRLFAEWWIESRRRAKLRSNRALSAELRHKGVEPPVIKDLLMDSESQENEILSSLIAKKRRLSRYQDDQKLIQYLARLGYGYQQIKDGLGSED